MKNSRLAPLCAAILIFTSCPLFDGNAEGLPQLGDPTNHTGANGSYAAHVNSPQPSGTQSGNPENPPSVTANATLSGLYQAISHIQGQQKEMLSALAELQKQVQAISDFELKQLQPALQNLQAQLQSDLKEQLQSQRDFLENNVQALQAVQPPRSKGGLDELFWALIFFIILAILLSAWIIFKHFKKAPTAPVTMTVDNASLERTLTQMDYKIANLNEDIKSLGSQLASLTTQQPDIHKQEPDSQSGIEWDRIHQNLERMDAKFENFEIIRANLGGLKNELDDIRATSTQHGNAIEKISSAVDTLIERIPLPQEEPIESEPEDLPLISHGDLREWLPVVFHEGGRLAGEFDSLVMQCKEDNSEAKKLLAGLLNWQTLSNSTDIHLYAKETHALSRLIFPYLRVRFGHDKDLSIEAIQSWSKAFKTIVEKQFGTLNLIAVYPEQRFDTDRMEAVRSLSSARLTVQTPLSWIIVEKLESGEKILHRAEVITA